VPKINVEDMEYIRSKKIKGKIYYYIVEGKLDKRGKVKQKVILYLGNINNIIKEPARNLIPLAVSELR
jgi:hypothetical protein